MLKYCPKCGRTFIDFDENPEEECDICFCVMKTVPDKYYEPPSSEYKLSDEMKQKLFEELVIPSDEFDQQLFDQRDGKVQQMLNKRNRIQSQIEARKAGKSNIPKCPTCGSTKVHLISTRKKTVGFLTVGVFSKNFGKTMECKNCGYKW